MTTKRNVLHSGSPKSLHRSRSLSLIS
jgi:hypothetical protein